MSRCGRSARRIALAMVGIWGCVVLAVGGPWVSTIAGQGPGCPSASGYHEWFQCCEPAKKLGHHDTGACGNCYYESFPDLQTNICNGECHDCGGERELDPVPGSCGDAPEDGESYCFLFEKTFMLYTIVDGECDDVRFGNPKIGYHYDCVCVVITDEDINGPSLPFNTCDCEGLPCEG